MEKVKLRKLRNNFLFCIISFSLVGCTNTENQEHFNKTLGLNIEIKKEIFNSEDAINPQGEGFSMKIISFVKKDADSLLLNAENYPKTYDLRKDWKISKWKKTPLVNKDVLELLFNYNISDISLKKELAHLKTLINSNDNFISYYFKESNGNIYAIDLYVLDVKNNKIYLCEIIT